MIMAQQPSDETKPSRAPTGARFSAQSPEPRAGFGRRRRAEAALVCRYLSELSAVRPDPPPSGPQVANTPHVAGASNTEFCQSATEGGQQ
jgi:hypothetical protein